jgi:hypothetical protein
MANEYIFTSRLDGERVTITAKTPEEARQQMRMRDAQKQNSPAGGLPPYALRLQQKGAEQRLTDLTAGAANDQRLAGQAQTFMRANELEEGTGPNSIGSMIPFLRNEPSQRMQSIAAEITPTMRQPGSGATSDFDAKMFQEATLGLDKSPEVNRSIGMGYVARAQRMQDRANAAEAWIADPRNLGTLMGFDAAWSKYANDNPIFDPQSRSLNPQLNPAAMSFADYMARAQAPQPPRGDIMDILQGASRPPAQAAPNAPPRRVYDPKTGRLVPKR